MILFLKFAYNTDLRPKKLFKSANYAGSAFFRKIDENYARDDKLCQKLC